MAHYLLHDNGVTLDNPPTISIAAGITVGLVASVIQSLGITIQRKSHVLNEQQPESEQVVEHRRPLWLLGFTIFISSNILGSLFQIASLPVVILAPLGAVSLLWNAFFAKFILGDVFSVWLVLGTILIAGGAVLIALFGIVPEPTHSLEDLLALFHRPAFITYFSLLGAFVLMILVITHGAEFSLRKHLKAFSPPETPPMSSPPSIDASASEETPLLRHDVKDKLPFELFSDATLRRTRLLLAVSYSSASGIISGMCLLFAKSGVELLLLSLDGQNQFWRWESWILLAGLVAFALLQLWYLHKSLVLADPTLVCPLAFCFYNVSSIMNSLVYYNQFELIPSTHLLLVILGTVILLAGVWTVSIQPGEKQGIDVGTFQEGEQAAEMDIVDLDQEVDTSRGTAQSLPPRLPSDIARARSQRRSVTTGHLRDIAEVDEPQIQLELEEEAVELDPEVQPRPPLPSRPSFASPRSSRRRRRYSFLAPSTSDSSIPQTVILPTGGFSIGLSPVSPGFALVPKRTLRMSLPSVITQLRMRRTLSESDIGATPNQEDSVLSQDRNRISNDLEDQIPGERTKRHARLRWNFMKSVVRGRKA